MTQDEIIEMARQASAGNDDRNIFFDFVIEELIVFAKLVATKEREACAKFIEQDYERQFDEPWRENLATAIRARGEA